MPSLGVFLIYVAVVLRAAVVTSLEPEFPFVIALLAVYGLLLVGKTWFTLRTCLGYLQSSNAQLAYLFLQSTLVIGALVASSYEDFLAMLFIPLSLDAVSFFGRRVGFIVIGILSLGMITTLFFSDVGRLFGLAMGILYSGLCFLVGGYAYQVENAKTAQDHNERMFNELQTAHRQLRGYAEQMASLAVEHERNRLSRELHDSVTQTVFSMNLAAQSAELLLEKEPRRAAEQLLRIEELAASAMQEIQCLVSELKPRSIIEEGLPAALRQLAVEQKARDGLKVSLDIQGERALSERVAISLYSIAHEALVNVSKHSGSCEAIVRLNLGNDLLSLEIEDHGLGFDPKGMLDQQGHLGLAGMSERAREIGWQMSVTSQPGQGTHVCVMENPSGAPT